MNNISNKDHLAKPYPLDKFDRILLTELDKNAAAPLLHLAKSLHRSKQFVLYRMKKLEQIGIITGYHAIVDMSKLGYFTFRIYFDLQNITETEKKEMINYLKIIPGIWTITTMHEKWDLALFLGVKNVQEFHTLREKICLRYKEKIKKDNVSIYAPIYNFNRSFLPYIPSQRSERTYGIGSPTTLSEFDLTLIKTYAKNVRQSSLEIAKILNVSADTVRSHIKKLEQQKVIVGYKLGLNLELLGYQSYRIDIELKSLIRNKELYTYCKYHKNIYQINKTIGGADFEIEVIVRDKQHLLLLIDELKQKFRDMIVDTDYFGFSTFHVLQYIPD